MKLTAESTVINDSKLNTNIDNAQATADGAVAVATSAQGTAQTALDRANGSVVTDTLHYLATSIGSGVTINTPGWTTTPQTITSENKYLWTYHTYTKADGTFTNSTPVITGTYGETGTSVTILGSYDTLAELEQEHPTGNLGDAYLVGGDLYVWNGTAWEDVGQIQGPEGPQGPQGDTGVGIAGLQSEYYLSNSSTTTTGGSWSTELTYATGKYIWTRERVLYTNGNLGYSTEIYNSALTTACSNSETALQIASDTAQYFWFTSSGTDTGAHISNKTQSEFISSPSGGNLLARSNGIAIRDGLTEMATFTANGVDINQGGASIANFGSTARLGKSADSHVVIAPTSIVMQTKPTSSGSPITTFEAKQTSTSVKTVRTYNMDFRSNQSLSESISIGRTVSSWTSVILKYKVNGGAVQTETYNSVPINDENANYIFTFSSSSATVFSLTFACGTSTVMSGYVTLVSVELNFVTAQQVLETAIGAYPNRAQSGPFRIGNGTASGSLANAMMVDWAGNGMFGGEVFVRCGSDSGTGIPLTTPRSLGEREVYVSSGSYTYEAVRVGRVIVLNVKMTKDAATAAGANLFDVTIAAPKPYGGYATGATFFGNHSIGLMVYTSGNDVKLRVRNASTTSLPAFSDELWGSVTYLTAY